MNFKHFFLTLLPLLASAMTNYIVCVQDPNAIAVHLYDDLNILNTISIGDFHAVVIKDPSTETLTQINHDDNTIYVERDEEVSIDYGWGLDRVNQKHLPLDGNDHFGCGGENIDIYILDTGIRTTHHDFGGRASWGTNTVGDGKDEDCQGPTYHGTHVASTAIGKGYGIARLAHAIAVKVLSCTGSGSLSSVMKGIEYSVTSMIATGKQSIMNLSLGGGKSQSLNAAIEQAVFSGMHTVVAAGNSNADACNYSPASAPSAITVAATDKNDKRAGYSNWGCCVDIFAPGHHIPAADGKNNKDWHYLSGTSMASPHVAGVVALILGESDKNLKPIEVVDALLEYATDDLVKDPKDTDNELLHMTCDSGDNKCEKKRRRRKIKLNK